MKVWCIKMTRQECALKSEMVNLLWPCNVSMSVNFGYFRWHQAITWNNAIIYKNLRTESTTEMLNDYNNDELMMIMYLLKTIVCVTIVFACSGHVKLSIAEKRIFQESLVNNVATDALAPCITRPSEVMILTMQSKQVLDFHGEGFRLPAPFQCWEMI